MIIHQREIGYGENYPVFFEALVKAKKYLEKNMPLQRISKSKWIQSRQQSSGSWRSKPGTTK